MNRNNILKQLETRFIDQISEHSFKFLLFLVRHGLWRNLSWDSIQVNFIISTGRTGTKFLATFLNRVKHIEARHEPMPDFLRLGMEFATGRASSIHARKRIVRDRRIVLKKLHKLNAKIYIESNNRLFSLIPVLRTIFKDCKIIHVVRDGRDVVRSGMSRSWYAPDDLFPRIKASDFPEDPYFGEWGMMSRFEKICWWWQKKDNFIYKSVQNRENCMTVKYEDIFDRKNGYPGLIKIMQFLEINSDVISNMDLRKVNETKTYRIPHWSDWEPNLRKQFARIAGEHMDRCEYL